MESGGGGNLDWGVGVTDELRRLVNSNSKQWINQNEPSAGLRLLNLAVPQCGPLSLRERESQEGRMMSRYCYGVFLQVVATWREDSWSSPFTASPPAPRAYQQARRDPTTPKSWGKPLIWSHRSNFSIIQKSNSSIMHVWNELVQKG